MATINSTTLAAAKRTLYFRVNKQGIPITLPFSTVTIDSDFQGFEPGLPGSLDPTGKRQGGAVTDAVYLKRDSRLPLPPARGDVRQFGVWEYHGI